MSQELFLDDLGEGLFQIRLERPERMNALGVVTVQLLEQAVQEASARQARVLLLRGSGRAFCAGADLKERKTMDLAARMAHNAGINAAVNAVGAARCVTVAVLNGLALGGGLELALACDLRIAAAGVSIGLTESRVGAFPGAGGTQRLPRVVGIPRALHMMLSGEPVTAECALSIGLVNEVVAPESLDEHAQAFGRQMAGRSAPAMAAIKRLVHQGMERTLEQGLALEREALPAIFGGSDYAEGLAAFAEKRPPRFTGTLD